MQSKVKRRFNAAIILFISFNLILFGMPVSPISIPGFSVPLAYGCTELEADSENNQQTVNYDSGTSGTTSDESDTSTEWDIDLSGLSSFEIDGFTGDTLQPVEEEVQETNEDTAQKTTEETTETTLEGLEATLDLNMEENFSDIPVEDSETKISDSTAQVTRIDTAAGSWVEITTQEIDSQWYENGIISIQIYGPDGKPAVSRNPDGNLVPAFFDRITSYEIKSVNGANYVLFHLLDGRRVTVWQEPAPVGAHYSVSYNRDEDGHFESKGFTYVYNETALEYQLTQIITRYRRLARFTEHVTYLSYDAAGALEEVQIQQSDWDRDITFILSKNIKTNTYGLRMLGGLYSGPIENVVIDYLEGSRVSYWPESNLPYSDPIQSFTGEIYGQPFTITVTPENFIRYTQPIPSPNTEPVPEPEPGPESVPDPEPEPAPVEEPEPAPSPIDPSIIPEFHLSLATASGHFRNMEIHVHPDGTAEVQYSPDFSWPDGPGRDVRTMTPYLGSYDPDAGVHDGRNLGIVQVDISPNESFEITIDRDTAGISPRVLKMEHRLEDSEGVSITTYLYEKEVQRAWVEGNWDLITLPTEIIYRWDSKTSDDYRLNKEFYEFGWDGGNDKHIVRVKDQVLNGVRKTSADYDINQRYKKTEVFAPNLTGEDRDYFLNINSIGDPLGYSDYSGPLGEVLSRLDLAATEMKVIHAGEINRDNAFYAVQYTKARGQALDAFVPRSILELSDQAGEGVWEGHIFKTYIVEEGFDERLLDANDRHPWVGRASRHTREEAEALVNSSGLQRIVQAFPVKKSLENPSGEGDYDFTGQRFVEQTVESNGVVYRVNFGRQRLPDLFKDPVAALPPYGLHFTNGSEVISVDYPAETTVTLAGTEYKISLTADGKLRLLIDIAEPGDTTDSTDPNDAGDTTDPNDMGDTTDPNDAGDTTDPNDMGDTTDPNDAGDTTDPNDMGDTTDPNDAGDTTDPNDTGDTTDPNDAGDTTDPNDAGDTTDPNDMGDTTDPNDAGDTTDPNDAGDTTDPNNAGDITEPPLIAVDYSFDAVENVEFSGSVCPQSNGGCTHVFELGEDLANHLEGLEFREDGTFTYLTPASVNGGSKSFTYRICENIEGGACSPEARVVLNIVAINDAPVVSNVERVVHPGERNTDDVIGYDEEFNSLRFEIVGEVKASEGLAANAITFTSADADRSFESTGFYEYDLSGIPADKSGILWFEYRVCETGEYGLCSGSAFMTLIVLPEAATGSEIQKLEPQLVSMQEDTSLVCFDEQNQETTCHVGPVEEMTAVYELLGEPFHGLLFRADGTYENVPPANFSGNQMFYYGVREEGATDYSAIGGVWITVENVNDNPGIFFGGELITAPQADQIGSLTIPPFEEDLTDEEGNPVGEIAVDLNDYFGDFDNESLSYEIIQWENRGFIQSSRIDGNELRFQLPPDRSGQVHVTIRATDSEGAWIEHDLLMTVLAVNDAPVLEPNVTPKATVVAIEDGEPYVEASFSPFSDSDFPGDLFTYHYEIINMNNFIGGEELLRVNVQRSANSTHFADIRFEWVAHQYGTADVRIWVTDEAGVPSPDFIYHVEITSDNQPPELVRAVYLGTLQERQSSGELLSTVMLSDHFYDPDIADEEPVRENLRFEIVRNTNPGLLTTQLTNGELKLFSVADKYGETEITVAAIDEEGARLEHTFTVPLESTNRPPVIPYIDPANRVFQEFAIEQGEFLEIDLTASINGTRITDPDGDPLIFHPGDLPAGASITSNSLLRYEPPQDFHGDTAIGFSVTDLEGSWPQFAVIKVHVNHLNTAPVLVQGIADIVVQQKINSNVPVSSIETGIDLTTVFSDPDVATAGDELHFEVTSSHAELVTARIENGILWMDYQEAPNAEENPTGQTTIRITAADNAGYENNEWITDVFTVTVKPANPAPQIQPEYNPANDGGINEGAYEMPASEDQQDPIVLNLNNVFMDPDNDGLTFGFAVNTPDLVEAALDESGNLTVNLKEDQHGKAVIRVTATDNDPYQPQTKSLYLHVNIEPTPDSPELKEGVTSPIGLSATAGQELIIDLSNYVRDADGTGITWNLIDTTFQLSQDSQSPNILRFNSVDAGNYGFKFRACHPSSAQICTDAIQVNIGVAESAAKSLTSNYLSTGFLSSYRFFSSYLNQYSRTNYLGYMTYTAPQTTTTTTTTVISTNTVEPSSDSDSSLTIDDGATFSKTAETEPQPSTTSQATEESSDVEPVNYNFNISLSGLSLLGSASEPEKDDEVKANEVAIASSLSFYQPLRIAPIKLSTSVTNTYTSSTTSSRLSLFNQTSKISKLRNLKERLKNLWL